MSRAQMGAGERLKLAWVEPQPMTTRTAIEHRPATGKRNLVHCSATARAATLAAHPSRPLELSFEIDRKLGCGKQQPELLCVEPGAVSGNADIQLDILDFKDGKLVRTIWATHLRSLASDPARMRVCRAGLVSALWPRSLAPPPSR